jgi:hypothetical protein
MIKEFVDRFIENKKQLESKLGKKHPETYLELVENVIEVISDGEYGEYGGINPKQVKEIDFGDYQGTKVYIIPTNSYQPSNFWSVSVNYGSCSHCDTLQSIRGYDDELPNEEQVNEYMKLALHIVQSIKVL